MWQLALPITGLAVLLWVIRTSRNDSRLKRNARASQQTLSIIIPTLNEAKALGGTLASLRRLEPQPHEVFVIDGGSTDSTAEAAKKAGVKLVRSERGRSVQMNAGAAAATGHILCFLHADSTPPPGLVRICRETLADPHTVLGGFRTLITGSGGRLLKFMTWHHLVKTYYLVVFARPWMLLNGGLCLFGDQTMFCRTEDFRAVDGFDETLPIMEDVQLCITMHEAGPAALNQPPLTPVTHNCGGAGEPCSRSRFSGSNAGGGSGSCASTRLESRRRSRWVRGRIRLVWWPPAFTSGRRLEVLGNFQATRIHFTIGLGWYFGISRQRLIRMYRDMYSDKYR